MNAISAITILRFLLSSEDSSAPAPGHRFEDALPLWKRMKAILWITCSVITAILLGQL